MASPENNLLLRLHKWAWRQDENFLTETLAHLIRHLLVNEPEAAVRFLASLTNGFLALRLEEARTVTVRTQVFTLEGTPDLDLRTVKLRVIVEVKVESEVRPDQLKSYRKVLKECGMESTQLLLLTRYPVAVSDPEAQPDRFIHWYQIADWIGQLRSQYTFNAVSGFLVDQFLEFLEARNMVVGQVTWELSGGVRALRTLRDMLCEVASACGIRALPIGGRDFIGVYLDKPNYRLVIYYEQPEVLSFETHYRRVDKAAAERLGLEDVYDLQPWGGKPGEYGWTRDLNLQSEATHFFARAKDSQMLLLREFLQGCLDTVRKIELPVSGTSTGADAADSGDTSPEEAE